MLLASSFCISVVVAKALRCPEGNVRTKCPDPG